MCFHVKKKKKKGKSTRISSAANYKIEAENYGKKKPTKPQMMKSTNSFKTLTDGIFSKF